MFGTLAGTVARSLNFSGIINCVRERHDVGIRKRRKNCKRIRPKFRYVQIHRNFQFSIHPSSLFSIYQLSRRASLLTKISRYSNRSGFSIFLLLAFYLVNFPSSLRRSSKISGIMKNDDRVISRDFA